MKKITAIILTVLMAVSLAACGNSGQEKAGDSGSGTARDTEISKPGTKDMETAESTEDAELPDTAEEGENIANEEESEGEDVNEGNVLVAYFSATNTTKGVAEHIADGLDADLYEIVPEEPYTDEDLDYNDDSSRSTIEMNDPASRPAISGSVEDMSQYDIVFIGYPIWWGEAPRIVSTFVESYDFSGKTVVPFCTSGGSGVGSSDSNLAALTDGAEWLPGERLDGGSSRETIVEWVNSLGLDIIVE